MTGKVLFVDDDPAFLASLTRQLRKFYDIHTAVSGKAALAEMDKNGPFAVVAADMQMPGMAGVELLSEFALRSPDTARIMLTGRVDLETVLEAVNEGSAFRFLVKPCPIETLKRAIDLGVEQHRRVTDLWETARTDALTGVSNRHYFFDRAEQEVKRARRARKPLSAIMLDADHFKNVNDMFGHAAGDEVLRMLARVCLENLREIDVFCRYGGEEFAILLADTDLRAAGVVAERLRHAIEVETVLTESGSISITTSLGVAADRGCDLSLETLLGRADTALYLAKRGGRNRVAIDEGTQVDNRSHVP